MPLRNIKLTIEYNGTHYHGWQTQLPKLRTIQRTIEDKLKKILNEKIALIGSGRTDAGVHALAQIANFKTASSISLTKLQYALNSLLPPDIVIKKVEEVDLGFHSRFSAKSKVYRYIILNRSYPSAFLKDRVYFYPYPLDINLMRKAAILLKGKHDFRCFQLKDKIERDSIRTIKDIRIKKRGSFIYIEIEADGFLYGMARSIVGTLIEIGKGKAIDTKRLLKMKDRSLGGPTVPASGLYLVKIKY
ncbi:MAG: tRNA pseudouridine(38-40) synthase TruA [Candidatus Omnitrophica bacterium]|nr:tRNA pseudouridine(38-40) synthase TruA [Candidatus Omnitrophota bacterium]